MLAPHATLNHAPLGAHPTDEGTTFRVWSTRAREVAVVLYDAQGAQTARSALTPGAGGIFASTLVGLKPGARYKFTVDGQEFPDPYARFLPDGVHGPAMVWQPGYAWQHPSPMLTPSASVIYELHVGTFTPEGTFEAARAKLPYLKSLGVTALELMPISAFPGARGWGYDGVAHYAPYAGYGSPEDLMAFIDAAHGEGLAVLLDVVYNHFGPDGNYLSCYSPEYFTAAHKTPWGDAPDFQNPQMRALVLDNVNHWLETYRFDGLRLDATATIADSGDPHLLEEIAARAEALGGRLIYAEDERNDPTLVTKQGLTGVWADDFHHMVRVLLTGERDGYYAAFAPDVRDLARTIDRGWLFEGQEVAPGKPARGKPALGLAGPNFVYCIQNHDQVGNRALGDRLATAVSPSQYRAVSMLLLFLPMTPLLFMGQEWGATTPFCYFSDHAGDLGAAVSRGRSEEFKGFAAFATEAGRQAIPDPQAASTFEASKLDWAQAAEGAHPALFGFYQALLRLRREDAVLRGGTRQTMRTGADGDVLWVRRWHNGQQRILLVNFGEATTLAALDDIVPRATRPLLSSEPMPPGTLARFGAIILEGETRA